MTKATYKNIGHSLCNECDKDDPRQEIWKQQRKERGWDDTELWNLDITFAEFLLPRLKEAKKSYSIDEEIMDKMIGAFESIANGDCFIKTPEEVMEGVQLFADNYFRLWN